MCQAHFPLCDLCVIFIVVLILTRHGNANNFFIRKQDTQVCMFSKRLGSNRSCHTLLDEKKYQPRTTCAHSPACKHINMLIATFECVCAFGMSACISHYLYIQIYILQCIHTHAYFVIRIWVAWIWGSQFDSNLTFRVKCVRYFMEMVACLLEWIDIAHSAATGGRT